MAPDTMRVRLHLRLIRVLTVLVAPHPTSRQPEGAENASQQVRGCAAGTLTGRESACGLPPITSRHLHG